ncbi:mannosyltransferase [Boothiomyces macroporosus]|uniref:Mannosyltransferase n=1 Tax=Boothiomyces macroporosus TaxID=261099 RepID=A0AAD5UHC8_9FUNG|nr:mannosyltransferase [Boothiomyces macroporosus]
MYNHLYVDISQCDYLVDTIPAETSVEDPVEPFYGKRKEWKKLYCQPFLDAGKTKFPARAFYFGGEKVWLDYCLYVKNR